jgi:hypothetical protein
MDAAPETRSGAFAHIVIFMERENSLVHTHSLRPEPDLNFNVIGNGTMQDS